MARLSEIRLYGSTTTAGTMSVTGPTGVFGLLYAVQWIDGTLGDGVDAVISTTGHEASQTLLTLTDANSDALYYPRAVVHSEAGAALTGTSGGDRAMLLMVGTPSLAVTSASSGQEGGCILFYFDG